MAKLNLEHKAKRVGSWLGRSVMAKLTLAVLAAIVIVNTAAVLNYCRLIRTMMCDYFMENIDENTMAVFSNEHRSMDMLNRQVELLVQNNSDVNRALAEDDLAPMGKMLRSFVSTFDAQGYVIADESGDIQNSSFSESYSDTQANVLAKFVKFVANQPSKSYTGIVEMLDRGPCLVTALALRDSADVVRAYAVICGASYFDSGYLRRCADYSKICLSTLRDSVCLASSIPPTEYFSMVGSTLTTPWVVDSIAAGVEVVHEHADVHGAHFFSSFSPIKDYSGKTVAICHASQDDHNLSGFIRYARLAGVTNGIIWGIIGLVVCIFAIRRFLLRPIRNMHNTAEAIAQGDLTMQMEIVNTGHDELQDLCESIVTIQSSLRETISSIAQTARVLHASSDELSRSSLQLSDGANKQAAALEEISSSLEEMTGNIHQNTDNAFATDRLMIETDKAVSSIADAATDSMINTRKIAGSIRSINSLVNQTNILSLNASVEAARAGSSGRGFAVVAKEVGRLAEQTKHTAAGVSDTAALSIAGAENINTLLDEVTPQLHKVVALVKEIAASSQEQGIGADQINIAINSLNKVTQEAAASAEEIAANAQELASSAESMRRKVDHFKL